MSQLYGRKADLEKKCSCICGRVQESISYESLVNY